MANWVIKSADNYLSLLYDRLHEIIYDNHIIHADETPVKVMRIDNNKIKNGIRPFTIGRKNFVLVESSNGAHASAIIYSLVETAKANYLNVYQYFELLLTEIPKHMNDTDLKFIEELLPWAPHVQETCPSRFKKS